MKTIKFRFAITLIGAALTMTSHFASATEPKALPTLAVLNANAAFEGTNSPGFATFVVALSSTSTKTIKVNYGTTDGVVNGALAGSDYVAKSGTLTFVPGEIAKSVRVNFVNNAVPELNEPFFLDINTPVNATIADSRASTYIKNDDGPDVFIDNALTVDEGNPPSNGAPGTTPQNFTVRLSAASSDTITVRWTTANNTAGPVDYMIANGTLAFAPGETAKTITVFIKGDTTSEPTETYRVNLTSPTYAILADSQGIGYIRNDDASALLVEDEPSQ